MPRDLTLVSTRLRSPTPEASVCISPSPLCTCSSRSLTSLNDSPRRRSSVSCSFSSTVRRICSSFSAFSWLLTVEQYAANIATKPGSGERVEYAIRLPGRSDEGTPVWLPVDAKFPREDYERLVDAQERADPEAAAAAALALERRIRAEAQTIAEKYLSPPHTTDFAILFVPVEGLYAEILRRPGLFEDIQRKHRVTVAGPTNLLAFLNSLQMGFRTLALEKRSSEVWQVLGAVKTEFDKFGDVLDKVRKKLDEASNQLDNTGVRTRAITRRLKTVQALPESDSERLLGSAADTADDE